MSLLCPSLAEIKFVFKEPKLKPKRAIKTNNVLGKSTVGGGRGKRERALVKTIL